MLRYGSRRKITPKGQQLVSDKVKVLDLDASHRGPSVATEYPRVLFPEAGVANAKGQLLPPFHEALEFLKCFHTFYFICHSTVLVHS